MSAEYNITFDWNRISTLGKVKVLVEQVVGSPSQEAISQAVEDYIEAHPGSLAPLSPAVKAALLQIAEKVAYVDANGQDYYDALDAALSAKALLSITAVYTQSGTVYDTDSLDSLKADLVVTAYYDDGTTADVTSACTLSGTLEEGTSTITATYQDKTATFDVTVAEGANYHFVNGTHSFSDGSVLTITNGNHVKYECKGTYTTETGNPLFNISDITVLGSAINDANSMNYRPTWFTIPNGATAVYHIKNAVASTSDDFTIQTNLRKASAKVAVYGSATVATKAAPSGQQSLTVSSATDVGCSYVFFRVCKANVTYEFDIELYVNGERYI